MNEAFQDLIGAAHLSEVVGASLADFLTRGQIDLGVLLENVTRSGQMRLYATRLVNDLGARVPVEISATRLEAGDASAIGIIVRDVSRLEGVRTPEGGNTLPDPGRRMNIDAKGF